ncbi:MAG: hypothetical protein NZN28_00885, partial [Meiothermus sp.]|uniref:hypothetical protein n=1 Tax=Meiothermus sp. TaxID=1955249 RepID=UPI0025E3F39B
AAWKLENMRLGPDAFLFSWAATSLKGAVKGQLVKFELLDSAQVVFVIEGEKRCLGGHVKANSLF